MQKSSALQIFSFITPNKLKKLLRQYAEAFHVTVYLLDRNREVFSRFPENEPGPGLSIKPLYFKESLLCYVAVPEGNASETHTDFIVKNLTEMIETGYEIESLAGEVVKNYEELSLLWRVSSRLGAGLNVDTVCNILADEVMDICPSKNISIMLANDLSSNILAKSFASLVRSQDSESRKSGEPGFISRVSRGEDADKASKMTLSKRMELIKYVFEKKEPFTLSGVENDKRFGNFPYPVYSILIVPLIVEDIAIGIIIASDKLNGEEFYTTEIKLIASIASECAISIKKALLFDEIHSLLFSTAEAFSFAIEAKDPYTYGHSKRVSEIAAKIAHSMGLSHDMLDWIRLAALLHDIGKIGTPESILHKVEKLNADEMSRIKEHPLTGAKMIEHVQRLKEIAWWICHHHEKYDGSGYPVGIKGNDIPLPSRIISMADTFDALTSDRPYRKAYTEEEAIKIMRESIGKDFDPVLFEYFIEAIS